MVKEIKDKTKKTVKKISKEMDDQKEELSSTLEDMAEGMSEVTHKIEKDIRHSPFVFIALAAGVSLFIGYIIGHKK